MKKINAERIKKLKDEINIPQQFCRFDVVFFSVAFALVFLFFGHPDLWETANHSYVLLESVFDGDFLGFYETVAAHDNSYYYINNANYNIVIYIIFALWELPIFVFNRLFGLALNEYFIWQWAKVVSTGFYIACGFMLKNLCRDLGFDSGKAFMAAMFFIFNPVAMFSPVVMGQYDSICLLFVLWALRYYLKGDLTKFSLVIGVGVVCKFYALLIFVPLLLLAEKRLVKILQHGITSLWLYIPTTLLFWGRTGDANQFTLQMINRLIATEMPGGMKPLPIFVVFYMIIVFAAYLYVPKSSKNKAGMALWLCLAVFGVLFASIVWHPQWLVLIVPFMVVTTFMQKNKTPWFILDIAFAAGFSISAFLILAARRERFFLTAE